MIRVSFQRGVPCAGGRHYIGAMRHSLRPHPSSLSAAGRTVEAEVTRHKAGTLSLRYIVTGDLHRLVLPPIADPARADELWRHTCFEAFVRMSPGEGYYELNFAPSTQWAAYRFTGYRTGMDVADLIRVPDMTIETTDRTFELQALVALDGLPDLPIDASWKVGLSAVIEDATGHKSYWALTHPAGKADFHHPDCFSLELPPA